MSRPPANELSYGRAEAHSDPAEGIDRAPCRQPDVGDTLRDHVTVLPDSVDSVGMSEITHLLEAAAAGDGQAAADLLPLVYEELRKLAAARLAAERPGHTLDATALVHEAYLRLIDRHPGPSSGSCAARILLAP
jgi:ECF sigma factor